jgi:hypothetical protein
VSTNAESMEQIAMLVRISNSARKKERMKIYEISDTRQIMTIRRFGCSRSKTKYLQKTSHNLATQRIAAASHA